MPIQSDKFKLDEVKRSKVNTLQVFSLDYTEKAKRNVKYIDTLEEEAFLILHKDFLKIFLSLFRDRVVENQFILGRINLFHLICRYIGPFETASYIVRTKE